MAFTSLFTAYWPDAGSSADWALRGGLFALAMLIAGRAVQVGGRPTHQQLAPAALLLAMIGAMGLIVATSRPVAPGPLMAGAMWQVLIIVLVMAAVMGCIALGYGRRDGRGRDGTGSEGAAPLRGRAMAWLTVVACVPSLLVVVALAASEYGTLVARVAEADESVEADALLEADENGAVARKELRAMARRFLAGDDVVAIRVAEEGEPQGAGDGSSGTRDDDASGEGDWDFSALAVGSRSRAYVSERHGYAVRLGDTGWSQWPGVRYHVPEAEVGFFKGEDLAFAVIPTRLMGLEPRERSLSSALLRYFEFNPDGTPMLQKRRFEQRGLKGTQFATHREVDGDTFVYLVRYGRANGVAYLLVGWVMSGEFHDLDEAAKLMERFTFTVPTETIEPEKLGTYASLRYGQFFNGIGLDYYQSRNYREAEAYFRMAARCNRRDPIYVSNAIDAMVETDRYAEAAAYLGARLDRAEKDPELYARSGWLLGMAGQTATALTHYRKAFDAGFFDEDYLWDYAELEAAEHGAAAALSLVRRYRAAPISPTMARLEAMLLQQLEQYDKAVDLLAAARQRRPADMDVAFALIEAMRSAGQSREALAIVDVLEADGMGASALHYQRGVLQSDLGWYRKAKRSLEAAAEIEPEDTTILSMLEYVSGQIGEGANWRIKTPLTAVEPPAGLWSDQADPALTDEQREASLVALRQWEGVEVDAEAQTLRRTRWARIRVNSKSGLDRLSSLSFTFDPLAESIYINDLRVFDAKGELVATGRVDDYYVVDESAGQIISFDKQLHAPVPGLEVGHIVEAKVTWQHELDEGRLSMQDLLMYRAIPVVEAAAFYRGPTSHFKAAAGPDARELDLAPPNVRAWRASDVPALRWEPLAVHAMYYLPYVRLGDARVTWAGAAQEYLGEIEDRLAIAPEVRELARELFIEREDDRAKLAAIVEHIQQALSYKAIEFGERGRVMPPASTTLRNRFGDCKDHSLLAYQLFQCAGIEAHLALVDTAAPLIESLPSLDQFNHMVVYLPNYRGGRVVDGTDKHTSPHAPVPLALAKQTMLVLDPDEPRLVKVPPYPPDASQLDITRTVERSGEADLLVRETLEAEGHYAAWLRGYFRAMEPQQRASNYQQFLSRSGSFVRVRALGLSGLEETAEPLKVEVTYLAPGAVQPAGDRLVVKLPTVFERDAVVIAHVDHRVSPFDRGYPLKLSSETTLRLPEGFTWTDARSIAAEFDHPSIAGKVSASRAGRDVTLAASVTQTPGRMPPEAFEKFQKTTERVVQAIGPRLVLHPE